MVRANSSVTGRGGGRPPAPTTLRGRRAWARRCWRRRGRRHGVSGTIRETFFEMNALDFASRAAPPPAAARDTSHPAPTSAGRPCPRVPERRWRSSGWARTGRSRGRRSLDTVPLRVGGAGGEQNGDEGDSEVFHGSLIGTTYDTSRPGEGGRATSGAAGEIGCRCFPGLGPRGPGQALGLGSGFQTKSADTRCGIRPLLERLAEEPLERRAAARCRSRA